SAGNAGATANLKLTFHLDHSAGADQSCLLGKPRQARGFLLLCVSQPSAKRSYGAGRPICVVEVEARACPLRQLQDDACIATAQAGCHAPAPEAVTAVTGYSSSTHHFLYDVEV